MTHPPWHLLASSQCPQYKVPAVVTSLCRIVVLNTLHQAHFCCIFVACSNSSFLVQDHQPASPASLSLQPPPGKPTTASVSNSHFFLINQTPASQASSLPDSNTSCENKDLTCFSGVSAVGFNLDFWQWGSVLFHNTMLVSALVVWTEDKFKRKTTKLIIEETWWIKSDLDVLPGRF